MRRAPTFFLAAGLLLLQAGTASAIDIEQIRPNAWAATQPEARIFNDCNSLIVEADEFVIVGHTRGDLIVSFGNIGVVATGDLVDAMPYSGHGYPREWLDALKAIQRLGATTYVPGHGRVLHDDLLIENLLIYFETLTSQVAAV